MRQPPVSIRQSAQWLRRPDNLAAVLYLSCLMVFASYYLGPTLFRTWFFSSDEYVFAAEVIRFAHGDFRQHFFDIPGTLFMLLDTALWCVAYGVGRLSGTVSSGIGEFTFSHLPALFVLMRATTLFFFLLSLVLFFVLTAKVINRAAAAVASLLLVMSTTYTYYSSFVRTESLALVLMLAALIWLMRDSSSTSSSAPPRLKDSAVIAGLLAGFAASARLHSLTAALPALMMILWMRKRPPETEWPRWIVVSARVVLPVGWLIAAWILWWSRTALTDLPGARRFLTIVAAGWIAVSVVGLVLYLIRWTRPLIVRVIRPDIVKLLMGCCIGALVASPTILTQYMYFLRGVHMYGSYLDVNRLSWPFWKNLTWYAGHYMAIIAPDKLTLVLLAAGTLLVIVTRNRKMLLFLAAAVLFFISKPLKLIAAPHHVILWLPFFFMICAYPIGWLFNLLTSRFRYGRIYGIACLAVFLAAYLQNLEGKHDDRFRGTRGPQIAASEASKAEIRLRNIQKATDWIKLHAEPATLVEISYFCFNPDSFHIWLRSLEVPVPASVSDGRNYQVWWGHASALRGKRGYACATPMDVAHMKTNLDLVTPGEGTDPYTDRRFQRLATFGSGTDQVDLFRFDYTQHSPEIRPK
jgi:hypothetical protein